MLVTGNDIIAITVLPTAVAAAPAVVTTFERVRQAEEGVVQSAPGVGAVASVALLLLGRRQRRR
jgi:MYXO-CTERM domain-containing protein